MKKVNLNYVRCENSGEYGLLIDGMCSHKVYAAMDGVLAAHDILEHINPVQNIGNIDDELEALAVTWWIRGVLNDLHRDSRGSAHSPYEHLAFDISHLAEYIGSGGANIPKLIKTQVCDYDDDFKAILSIARKNIRQTILDDIHSDTFRCASEVNRYFDAVIHYLRRGYRKAKQRYKKLGQIGTNRLFWQLADQIDNDLGYLDVGDRLTVFYSLTTGEVKTYLSNSIE